MSYYSATGADGNINGFVYSGGSVLRMARRYRLSAGMFSRGLIDASPVYLKLVMYQDVSHSGHEPPWNFGVLCLDGVRQPPGGFANDLHVTKDVGPQQLVRIEFASRCRQRFDLFRDSVKHIRRSSRVGLIMG